MRTSEFDALRSIVYDKAGIALGENKQSLVSSRLGKRLRILGLADIGAYIAYLRNDSTGAELVEFIDAISTNVTSFYREPDHFEFLASILEDWLQQGQRRVRIWCAASSTGEEPFTIAMTALETIGSRAVDLKILATDISTRVLRHCSVGEYAIDRLAKVPDHLRKKYFEKTATNGDARMRVRPALQNVTVFRRLNLAEPPYPMRGPLDVIFCRNVMIYFDNHGRERFLREAQRLLKPGGYLIVGHTESLTGVKHPMRTLRPSIYINP